MLPVFSFARGSLGTIASEGSEIPQIHWTWLIDFVGSEMQFKGNQCSFARGRVKGPVRHRAPVQQLPDQRPLSTPPVNSQAEAAVFITEIDMPVSRPEQQNIARMEEMMRQLQESMKLMQ